MGATRGQVASEVSLEFSDSDIGELTLLQSTDYAQTLEQPLLSCWRYRYLKRVIDVACSVLLIVAFAVPGLLIALLVLLTSRGPIFYREERIGRGGLPFRIWKFRSMYCNTAHSARSASKPTGGVVLEWRMQKHLRDPRITFVGGFLRRWSLDELPQLFNVLRGEMSLIGPRPIVQAECALYGDLIDYYLAATPGISGLWQVSGRSNLGYFERTLLDAQYVQEWSPALEIKVFFLTFPAVLGRIGAR